MHPSYNMIIDKAEEECSAQERHFMRLCVSKYYVIEIHKPEPAQTHCYNLRESKVTQDYFCHPDGKLGD